MLRIFTQSLLWFCNFYLLLYIQLILETCSYHKISIECKDQYIEIRKQSCNFEVKKEVYSCLI